jgi:methyl-accepting chemotaxis protein
MWTAITLALCSALVSIIAYFDDRKKSTLIIVILTIASAVATIFDKRDSDKKTNTIIDLNKIDTSLSHHIDTLQEINLSFSSSTNKIVETNKILSDSIKDIDSGIQKMSNKIANLAETNNLISNANKDLSSQILILTKAVKDLNTGGDSGYLTLRQTTAPVMKDPLKNAFLEQIQISLYNKGEYSLDNVKIWVYGMNDYQAMIPEYLGYQIALNLQGFPRV